MISVLMSSNERGSKRATGLANAIARDKQKRFAPIEFSSDIPGDIQFRDGDMVVNVELKDFTGNGNSDLLASINNGHLYLQTLKLRAAGHPAEVDILGSEDDMDKAIHHTVKSRGLRGDEYSRTVDTYENLVYDFEANCWGQNIGFRWLKRTPWRRILSSADKTLHGGDLSSHGPKKLAGEELVTGLSIIAGNGIGKSKAASILSKFRLKLDPMEPDTYLDDCDGIGKILAESVGRKLNVPPDKMLRPQKKATRGDDH